MMNERMHEILEAYQNGVKSLAETNAALAEAGAGFHLNMNKNPSGGWTEAEMAAGFHPGEEAGEIRRRPDMARRMDLAGQCVRQETAGGAYAVTYNAQGYAEKAEKL